MRAHEFVRQWSHVTFTTLGNFEEALRGAVEPLSIRASRISRSEQSVAGIAREPVEIFDTLPTFDDHLDTRTVRRLSIIKIMQEAIRRPLTRSRFRLDTSRRFHRAGKPGR